MTWQIAIMFVLVAFMMVAFISEKLPLELTGMSAFALVLVLGLLPPEEGMKVFANAGPIAIGAMFIISAALEKCGAIEIVAVWLEGLPKYPLRVVLPILILCVAAVSAFINNTGVVIVFLPVVLSLARRIEVPVSKLLIPLSFASILGGSCTLIGTSTNIVVSSMASTSGQAPFGMFELALVGVPLLVVGTLYLTVLGPFLLPHRAQISEQVAGEDRREYIVEAFVKADSPLIGKLIADTDLNRLERIRVLEVFRGGGLLRRTTGQIELREGDRLLLVIAPGELSKAQKKGGLDFLESFEGELERIRLF